MNIFKKLLSGVTGGLAGTAIDIVNSCIGSDISTDQKLKIEYELKRLEADVQHKADIAALEAQSLFNQRLFEHEGTATDLKAVPFLGPIILFLRGVQRPAWGFATLYIDFMWFSSWSSLTNKQEQALIVINLLVLGFLFGERAVKNVMPLFIKLLESRAK